ncbi:aldose 1-epimerase family protein [Parafilimonas terrae]|uniref:Galactose mutarotase n=1 Tax=Parafilimonas terrae TaxID=1465490 RepID=A0A1I5RE96_9BACT|nr:aldose 1-epimerase family protein [Parafilimonas terrae]SFP56700.1 Galactose mutarotase [Parafilimonas terrae]
MVQLQNNKLSVIISEKGAELQSLQLNNIEYLWQADAAFWGKHSPVLFPIVGELKDGKYIFNDKEYKLSRHGFARDKMFEVTSSSQTQAVFSLKSDEATLSLYPFPFIFNIIYAIDDASLSCTYQVTNTGNGDMYFSVGGHPAFKVPLNDQLQYTDYFLLFNSDAVLNRYLLHQGLTGDETEKIILNNKTLPLKASLFYEDAIVLKHIGSDQVKLFSDKDEHGLNFNFKGFPYFGIWAAKDAPFVCLEPWCGIADNIHHNHQLTTKEGINILAAGKAWEHTWSVELF